MKFTKKINCLNCPYKCGVFDALKESGHDPEKIESIHAEYRKHELICKQGNDVTHSIYLVQGTAKLFIEGLNNRNIILYILKPDSYIGLLSFFETINYTYSVMTLEECCVCMLDLAFLKKLYLANHQLYINLNKALGKSVAAIMKKLISLNQKQIRGRIAENLIYLSKFHGNNKFNLGLTRKELGEMSAISEENAVRILSELRNENVIDLKGKEIEILDMNFLQKISEIG